MTGTLRVSEPIALPRASTSIWRAPDSRSRNRTCSTLSSSQGSSRRCRWMARTNIRALWLRTGRCRSNARARIADRLRRTFCRRTIRRRPARLLGSAMNSFTTSSEMSASAARLDAIAHPCGRCDTFFQPKEPALRNTFFRIATAIGLRHFG